ncbi:MAG: hypothetical protein ACLTXH_04455 [Enterobacter hormaechei]
MIAAWKKITAGVHAEEGRIAVQLWHTGRMQRHPAWQQHRFCLALSEYPFPAR